MVHVARDITLSGDLGYRHFSDTTYCERNKELNPKLSKHNKYEQTAEGTAFTASTRSWTTWPNNFTEHVDICPTVLGRSATFTSDVTDCPPIVR